MSWILECSLSVVWKYRVNCRMREGERGREREREREGGGEKGH